MHAASSACTLHAFICSFAISYSPSIEYYRLGLSLIITFKKYFYIHIYTHIHIHIYIYTYMHIFTYSRTELVL